VGKVVAAVADEGVVDTGPEILEAYPLLVYVYPGHYAGIRQAERFRFPRNYKP
jgi:hypothetical protein